MFVAWKLDFLCLMKTHIPEQHCWFWIPATTNEQHARLISHNHLHIGAVGKYRSVSSVHTLFLLYWGRYCPSHVAVCISMWLNLTNWCLCQSTKENGWLCREAFIVFQPRTRKQTKSWGVYWADCSAHDLVSRLWAFMSTWLCASSYCLVSDVFHYHIDNWTLLLGYEKLLLM